MKLRIAITVLLLVFGVEFPIRSADAPLARPLSLTVGKGELLQFDQDISRVVIAEPKIADAVVVSPRNVLVNAKGAGQTTLVIWESETSLVRYDITVLTDRTEANELRDSLSAELKAAMPDAAIAFSGNAETMVLTGMVANVDQSKRAEAIAATHAKK